MSWKQLEEAIKNRPKFYPPKAIAGYSKEEMTIIDSFERWFEDFIKKFAEFKKQCVCIPKTRLESSEGIEKTLQNPPKGWREFEKEITDYVVKLRLEWIITKTKNVCIPRKQLEEFITFLYSQAPLFCTHGKNELDCMQSDSPCKRNHQKDCPVYLRIKKIKELLAYGTVSEETK